MSTLKIEKHPILANFNNGETCRENARLELEDFLNHRVLDYAFKRNFDFGQTQRGNTSCLSLWISQGVLLEQEVISETLKRYEYKDVEKFIQEIFWRTYFKGWLEHRPQVWFDYTKDLTTELERMKTCQNLYQKYDKVISSQTHLDCMNAWAKELIDTGYLHNHARMWFASIWIFTLKLPWQLGADFFLRHLHDGDAASNTLSWRWVAGLHTKGKHYIASQSNIEKFTNGQFSPQGLVTNPTPIKEDKDYQAQSLKIPSHQRLDQDFGLIISQAHCHAKIDAENKKPSAIFVLPATNHNERNPTAQSVSKLRQKVVMEAATKTQAVYNCPIIDLDYANMTSQLIMHCQSKGIKHLTMPYLTVGPIKDAFTPIFKKLEDAGIKTHQIMRAYDKAAWHYSNKGYFHLKKNIPELIKELGL